jgi:amidohydrolase
MTTDIDRIIASELESLTAIRRDLHRHPELSYQEKRTAGVAARELAAIGAQVKQGVGVTGVLGYLPASDQAGNAKPAVALRADMDALPIVEETGKPYASCISGLMHACGHDGHTTILIGAARVLSKIHRPRPVLFVFQPAEEGGAGGDRMCKDGAMGGQAAGGLGNPVGCIYGLHGWPTVDLGNVACKPGPILAATDDFVVRIHGTQSHGAYPHQGHDPILATSHIITQLQSVASRNVSPLDSVVVTVGAIHAGTASNIIPQSVEFIGTIRTLRKQTRAMAKERFFAIVEGVAKSMGCRAEILWEDGYPVTDNEPKLTHGFFETADGALGSEKVVRLTEPSMGGEDFAYYGAFVPSCFYQLGLKPAGMERFPTLHQPDFDFNDDAIPVGVKLMSMLATKA